MDYGYLAGAFRGDGDGIDFWRESFAEPTLGAIVCTVGAPEERAAVYALHNDGEYMAAILVERQ